MIKMMDLPYSFDALEPYYLQYKTKRKDYVDKFYNILNWNIVNKRWKSIEKNL